MNNVTFIIPAKLDSQERINNLDFMVSFIQKNFGSPIIIMEEDERSYIQGRYQNVTHVFTKTLFPLIMRTRIVNEAVNELVTTEIICIADMDVFIDPERYRQAVDLLNTHSVVYPFNGHFYEVPNNYTQNKNLKESDIKAEDKILLNTDGIGAMVFMRTKDHIAGGMENDHFLGWGYDDNERYIRFKKLGYRIKQMDNPIYHFSHPRNYNSSGLNPHINRSREEFERISGMSRQDLVKYINDSFYWCRHRKIIPITIVIPTYEADGKGVGFVGHNISKIFEQTFPYWHVIVSDHSENMDIENLVRGYKDERITYIRNTANRGSSSANLNFGIMHAGTDIIKPMFFDDYFKDNRALEKIHDKFVNGAKWCIVGSDVTTDRVHFSPALVPRWNDDMVYGHNTMGSPSCVAYLRDYEISWDENLLWLIDCKFYHEMYKKHGLPEVISDTLVSNFMHKLQITNKLTEAQKAAEVALMRKTYPK